LLLGGWGLPSLGYNKIKGRVCLKLEGEFA